MKNSNYSWGKKTLAFILTFFMIISVLPMTAMQANAATVRDTAVAYMREMATIKWTPSKTITYWSGSGKSFKAGTTYSGMPYTQNNRQNLATFKKYLKSGKYTGPSTAAAYVGNDCSSAVRFAWLHVNAKISFTYTGNMFPTSNTGVLPVGSYSYTASKSSTKTIISKSGSSTMYNAYAQLKPGDAIFARVNGVVNHARLVSKVNVVKTGGKVDANKSTVSCIEQCGISSSRKNTTWNVDKTYTFANLCSTYYIPITCEVIKNSSDAKGASTLKISSYNKPLNVKEGKEYSIYGKITSNYKITSVTVGIYDTKGKAVSSKTVKPNATSYDIKSLASSIKFSKAKAGTYTYKVTAKDEKKSATLVNHSFKVVADAASTLAVIGYNYPPASLTQGTTFTATGKVTSNYKIKSVTLGIYNAAGKAVYSRTAYPVSTSYDYRAISSDLKFQSLSAGTYSFRISATDEKTSKTLLNKTFTVKVSAEPASTLKIASYNYPITIDQGTTYSITGTVSSNYNISSVTVGIYNASNVALSSKSINPAAKSYSIAYLMPYIKFNTLKPGTYYYKVSATDSKKTATLLYKSFTVKELPAASTLLVTGGNYPTTLYHGEMFYSKGTVKSNYNISSVVYGAYDANGKAVTTKSVYPNSKSYLLNTYNYDINFHKLAAGTYYYKVTAKDSMKSQVLVNQKFTVKNTEKSLSYTTYTTSYRSTFDNPNSTYTYKYTDDFFAYSSLVAPDSSSKVRTGKFAAASCAMASAVYIRDYISTALRKMGFTIVAQLNYDKKGEKSTATTKDNDFVGFTIAKKNIYVGGILQYTIYPIIVRGTNGYEWISNFNMGTSNTHRGFQIATDKIYTAIATYMPNINKNRDKIWITGHSRGAAVTNLLAAKLTKTQKYAKPENIHAFAYACPATTTAPEKYTNILNFNNEYDFVPNVPLKIWKYSRHGVTYNINEDTGPNFSSIKAKFKSYTTYTKKIVGLVPTTKSQEYKGLTKKQVNSIINNMGKYAPTIASYYQEYTYGTIIKKKNTPSKVFNTLGKTLGKTLSLDTLSTVGIVLKDDPSSDIILGMIKNLKGITCAHSPEFYLAWMAVNFA